MKKGKAPSPTVSRLSIYYGLLVMEERRGRRVISSRDLGRMAGTSGAQVRRDLSAFGTFGLRGAGYRVKALRREIGRILGKGRRWRAVLVGAGNLGGALLSYSGFPQQGFSIVTAFDVSPRIVGKVVGGVKVRHVRSLGRVLRRGGIRIGIVAVPAAEAQAVVDTLVRGGVEAILNFAPVCLVVPSAVELRSVDLSVEMDCLAYSLLEKS